MHDMKLDCMIRITKFWSEQAQKTKFPTSTIPIILIITTSAPMKSIPYKSQKEE